MTTGIIEYMNAHPELLERLPLETLQQLWELVKAEKKKAFSGGIMPESAVTAMTDVVDTKLMQDIVSDLRKVAEPGGLVPPTSGPQKDRGSGWKTPPALELPSGVKYVDQIADHFAELDKIEAQQRFTRRI